MSRTDALIHYHLVVTGLVQGVGYRFSALEEAVRLGVRGYVRNADDGSVEIDAEGPRTVLNRLKDWCRCGPRGARVTGVECVEGPVKGYDSFHIVH